MTGDAAPIDIVRHARARRMRLAVDVATGRVRLTIPKRLSARTALAWAAEQQEWIAAQRARMTAATPFVAGAVIPIEGEPVTIVHDASRSRIVRREGATLVTGGPAETLARRVDTWLRRHALATLSVETSHFAALAGVVVTRVGIGDARSRWGSCASSGAIRYSWRLILAPPGVRRATVAHEVAHRVEMNHGPQFHALVDHLLRDEPVSADVARAWLRAQGTGLHRIGAVA